jgi:hypothetical protein
MVLDHRLVWAVHFHPQRP